MLTLISDRLAASISRTRAPDEKHGKDDFERVLDGVRFLWRPDFYVSEEKKGNHWAAFRTADELKDLFSFIEKCNSPEEFLEEYKTSLLLTPEDKSAPRNIISLRTHLDLTGKVFRVLWNWTKVDIVNNILELEYDNQKITHYNQATGEGIEKSNKGKWIFRLIKCRVRNPQSIARLQDLNVLKVRGDIIKKIILSQKLEGDLERQKYAVLFNTDDFLCLLLPRESILRLRDVVSPLLQNGFWIEYEELEAELGLITSHATRVRENLISNFKGDRIAARKRRYLELRSKSIWPELSETITPPLCDLCQQRQGQRYAKEQIVEYLCSVCYGIREMGEPAKAISSWEEAEKQVMWLKLSLDQELLLQCLQRLFNDYVDNGPGMGNVPPEIRNEFKTSFKPLAAQMEFVRQYHEFLEEFHDLLLGQKGYALKNFLNIEQDAITYPIQAYKELVVIRLDNKDIYGLILDAFDLLLRKWFPKCLVDCPIKLAASVGNIKYPYQGHWRFLEEKQMSGLVFYLQQPGIRKIELTSRQFVALREKLKGRKLSHALHQLAAVETEIGELNAMVQALEQRKQFPQIVELIWQYKLSLKQILDFYRIAGMVSDEVILDV